MTPYYADDSLTLYHGQSLDVTRTLADQSVNCVVTSPPYYGLRDYDEPGQYGLEATPAEYVENIRALFSEVRRVLADDGTLWLNLGDSYSGSTGSGAPSSASTLRGNGHIGGGPKQQQGAGRPSSHRAKAVTASPQRLDEGGLPAKNLLGMPWRVAFALQDDGWILRNAIVWNKSNAMPESVTDRLTNRHELVFMFSKSRRYWFDLDPIREPHVSEPGREGENYMRGQKAMRAVGPNSGRYSPNGANPGDVWTIATVPFPGAHFAVFPPEMPRRCILAGCKPGGTVLDPFSGSGTTGMVAGQLGRRYIGIDLSAKYLADSLRTRLAQTAALDGGAA